MLVRTVQYLLYSNVMQGEELCVLLARQGSIAQLEALSAALQTPVARSTRTLIFLHPPVSPVPVVP